MFATTYTYVFAWNAIDREVLIVLLCTKSLLIALIKLPHHHIVYKKDGCIDEALRNVKAENSVATEASDLDAIRSLVQSLPGACCYTFLMPLVPLTEPL